MYNILLCGFMGCGKTTVGRRLARLLEWEYMDLDEEIEKEQGIPIPQIFAEKGEQAFRELEHQAIVNLARRIRCVVSTGGGAMTYSRNVEAVDKQDTVVFLDGSFDICYQRIAASARPLVRQSTPQELKALFEKRRHGYLAAANIIVDAAPPPDEVTRAVHRALSEGQKIV